MVELAPLAGVCVVSLALSGAMVRWAPRLGLVDVPNARSAHREPTPRGGGVAFVVAITLGELCLLLAGDIPMLQGAVLVAGGLAMAVLGLCDDLAGLRPRTRLVAQILSATLCVAILPLPDFGTWGVELPLPVVYVLVVLGLVWLTNLYNFMDGIDGIVTVQGLVVLLPVAGLMLLLDQWRWLPVVAVFVAGLLGFLPWNWQRARIFMGDAGSAFLGFSFGLLLLVTAGDGGVAPWVWLALLGCSLADTGVALLRRLVRGDNLAQAHASHAYQVLARRWGSHRRVCALLATVTLAWQLPLAWLLQASEGAVAFMLLWLALVPPAVACWLLGSGRAPPQQGRKIAIPGVIC